MGTQMIKYLEEGTLDSERKSLSVGWYFIEEGWDGESVDKVFAGPFDTEIAADDWIRASERADWLVRRLLDPSLG